MLDHFSLDNTVSALSAKQDRVTLEFRSWLLIGSVSNIDALRNTMGAPPADLRSEGLPLLDIWGKLFDRPNQHLGLRKPLKIRSSPLSLGSHTEPAPLFGGEWKFGHYYSVDEESERECRTYLNLWLNPTRFVRYQSPVPMPSSLPGAQWPVAQMFSLPHQLGDEFALDGNDNWIPNTQRFSAFAGQTRWWRHLRAYLLGIRQVFSDELYRINHLINAVHWSPESTSANLKSVETYWEFYSENPTGIVASLAPLLKTFSRHERVADEYSPVFSSEIDHNALCISAIINPGRKIKIYAKTTRRIRIEVVHELTGRKGYRIAGGHTTSDCENVLDIIGRLADDAATLINRMLSYFRNQNSVEPSHISAMQLVTEICFYSRDANVASTITSLLVINGCISAEGLNVKMQRALHRLSSANVISFNGGTGNYTVSAARRYALSMLRQHGDTSLLAMRRRRRASVHS